MISSQSQIQDEEKLTKYFLFTLMAEKKFPTDFISDLSFYRIGAVIGKSSFASSLIYAGQFIKTGELVAIKKHNVESLSVGEIKLIEQEVGVTNKIINPFILTSLISFVSGWTVISILPLLEYGSCFDLIRNYFQTGLPEMIINLILKDIVRALRFIHLKGIIHRAIKASHILMSSDGHAKLSGFRYAYKKQNESNLLGRLEKVFEFPAFSQTNLNWLSPDILQQNLNGYSEKSDVYSLGITVCELTNGFVPYKNHKLTSMIMEKIKGNIPAIYDSSTLHELSDDLDDEIDTIKDNYYAKKFSKNLHNFKNLCCILRPEDRPDTELLMIHPLFSRISKRRRLFSEHIVPAVSITEKNFMTFNCNLEGSNKDCCNTTEYLFDWKF